MRAVCGYVADDSDIEYDAHTARLLRGAEREGVGLVADFTAFWYGHASCRCTETRPG